MVCSCAMSLNYFWLQILFCLCVNETTLFSYLRSRLRENDADCFASRRYSVKNKLGDRMIKQSLNSVIAKYRDLSVSCRSIICRSRIRLRGGSRIFFRRGCTRLFLYFNTNKPHSFFFAQYQLYWKTAGHLRGGGCAPPAPSPKIRPCASAFGFGKS